MLNECLLACNLSYIHCRHRRENRCSHAMVVFLGDKRRDKPAVDVSRERRAAEKYVFSVREWGTCMLVHKPHNHTRLGSFDPLRVMYHE